MGFVGSTRYDRQTALQGWGEEGQRRLMSASVLLVGCGGLGGTVAQLLVRAGLGRLRLVDPDRVSLSNIHRQILYSEQDATQRRPKVEAAGRALGAIGGPTKLELVQGRFGRDNAGLLLEGADLALDGTDNLATRFLLNDACLDVKTPWIYGGISETSGAIMPIIPDQGPCLRCLMPGGLPPAEQERSWGGAGVLNTIPTLVAAIQASEALKLLVGGEPTPGRLLQLDVWQGHYQTVEVPRVEDCPSCAGGSSQAR